MGRSRLHANDRSPEKGQQTLTALFAKATSLRTKSKCHVCHRQIDTAQLTAHKENCFPPEEKPALSQDNDDSDIEIIEVKTPIKKPTNQNSSSAYKKGTSGTKASTGRSATGAVRSTSGAAASLAGTPDSLQSETGPSTVSAVESTTDASAFTTATPCKDAAPAWGHGSPQITEVIGGGAAAALCKTSWSPSSSTPEKSEPATPRLRCKVVGVGGWLVSPARSPSVSPSGRILPSPGAVTPGGTVTPSPAAAVGQAVSPASRVGLSPAVGKSPGGGGGPRRSAGRRRASLSRHSTNVDLPSCLNSTARARRNLYGDASGAAASTTSGPSTDSAATSTAGQAATPVTAAGVAQRQGEGGAAVQMTDRESQSLRAGSTGVGGGHDAAKAVGQGLLSPREKMSSSSVTGPDNESSCSAAVHKGYGSASADAASNRVPLGVVSENTEVPSGTSSQTRGSAPSGGSASTSGPTPASDLAPSADDEVLLSQEFGSEMPEMALLSQEARETSQPYYLKNFLFVVDSVMADPLHAPLLDDADLGVVSRFRALPAPAQMLYVRMFQRKHAWLRPEKLRYAEIGDASAVAAALDRLAEAALIDTEQELSGLMELAGLLSAPELHQLCQQLHLTATGRRQQLLKRLTELERRGVAVMFGAAPPGERAALLARRLLGRCVRVSAGPRRVLLRLLSLFHLPLYEDDEDTSQQLLTLLMVDLGRAAFPPVTVNRQTAIFATREDLLRYEAASQVERQLRVAMETKQWEAAFDAYEAASSMRDSLSKQPELRQHDAALPAFLRKFTASSIITYVLSKSVEVLQRRREHEAAVSLLQSLLGQETYLADYRGFWADRLALTLHQHLRRPADALAFAKSALDDPAVVGGRRLAVEQRVARLDPDAPSPSSDSVPRVEIEARCLPRNIPGMKMVFLGPQHSADGDVTVCSVEEVALAHYGRTYSEGVHRESATVVTLFALLFWDLLYSVDVPDSFRSAYQTLPLDLNSPAFFERRREAVLARLSELASGSEEDACRLAAAVWEEHHGCRSLASWDVFRDCEHALSLIRCLGMEAVTAICRRLATEYRISRSGFPDLVVWSPADCTARIVEVKGPGDRLSTKQILWIQYLLKNGAHAEVCYVKALGRRGTVGPARAEGKTKRRRSDGTDDDGEGSADAGGDGEEGAGQGDGEGAKKKKRRRRRKQNVQEAGQTAAEAASSASTSSRGTSGQEEDQRSGKRRRRLRGSGGQNGEQSEEQPSSGSGERATTERRGTNLDEPTSSRRQRRPRRKSQRVQGRAEAGAIDVEDDDDDFQE